MIFTGEIDAGGSTIGWTAGGGAEGATTPETLRQRDREKMALWRVRPVFDQALWSSETISPPKGKTGMSTSSLGSAG